MIKIEIYVLKNSSQQLSIMKIEGERVGKKDFVAVLDGTLLESGYRQHHH